MCDEIVSENCMNGGCNFTRNIFYSVEYAMRSIAISAAQLRTLAYVMVDGVNSLLVVLLHSVAQSTEAEFVSSTRSATRPSHMSISESILDISCLITSSTWSFWSSTPDAHLSALPPIFNHCRLTIATTLQKDCPLPQHHDEICSSLVCFLLTFTAKLIRKGTLLLLVCMT